MDQHDKKVQWLMLTGNRYDALSDLQWKTYLSVTKSNAKSST